MQNNLDEKTHFGYREVESEKKETLVKEVFDSVSKKYDIMNDVMSFGIHRFWKYYTLLCSDIRPGMNVLDLASGTGDIALKAAKLLKNKGHLVASDINENMLNIAKKRLYDAGHITTDFVIANAEELPFEEDSFDRVTMAFGLRNVTHKDQALKEMYRVLKPGGKALVLEFSKPVDPLFETFYDAYSFNALPNIGKVLVNDSDSYRYLAESIRVHPRQEVLKDMFKDAGFSCCKYKNLSLGMVALHQGIKI